MQLCAATESFYLHCRDADTVKLHVLFKASTEMHRRQYDKLKEEFHDVSFVEEVDFRKQVLTLLDGFTHVLFVVDDNLFVGDFYLADILRGLYDNRDTIGFSLRLGANTSYCYARSAAQRLPHLRNAGDGILTHDWTAAEYDFGYPLEVSSSVYRCSEILPLLNRVDFANPNTL